MGCSISKKIQINYYSDSRYLGIRFDSVVYDIEIWEANSNELYKILHMEYRQNKRIHIDRQSFRYK